jgi:hypothetical protein
VHVLAVDLNDRFAELVTVTFNQAPDLKGITGQGLGVLTCKLDPNWPTVTEFPSEDAPSLQLGYNPQHRYDVIELVR